MELTSDQAALRARREAVVLEHVRCERKGTDIEGAVATFHGGHATYDVVPLEHTKAGGQELTHPTAGDVRRLLSELTTGFPDLELEIVQLHHADDAVVVEGRTRGTHAQEWAGIAATGRTIDVRAAVVYRFDGDRMTNETIYFDLATQLRQLGLETMEL